MLRPILWLRKCNETSIREECTVGPTKSWSLRGIPVDDFTEASKTALILVVVLDSFMTACIGK